ncbi:MAG: Omp28-related outer membrane protein [Bacteroidota bacterium]
MQEKLYMRLSFVGLFLSLSLWIQGQPLVSEDFESRTLPPAWSVDAQPGSTGWEFGSADDLSPASWKIPTRSGIAASNDDDCDCDKRRDLLWMPSVQPVSGARLFLQFDAYIDGFFGSVGKVVVTRDGGSSFSEVFTVPTSGFWETYTLDVSNLADGNALQLGFLHDDSGNWATGFGVDNVTLRVPADDDASLTTLDMVAVVEAGVQTVPIIIRNEGAQAISNLTVSFQVATQSPVQQTLSGLNISPLASDTLMLTDIWQAGAGEAQLSVEILQVNGKIDPNPQDNRVQRSIGVANQLAPALMLLEHFTQHNCDICADQNPVFNQVVSNNKEEVAVVAYHTFWPSPDDDPMHQANPQPQLDQIAYYDIVAVPRAFANGSLLQGGDFEGAPNGLSTQDIQRQNRQKGLYQLDLSRNNSGSVWQVNLNVTPLYQLQGIQPQLKVAVVEELVTFTNPPGDNGERNFGHVFRSFLSGSTGENIATVGINQTISRNYSLTLDPAWNPDRLRIIAWVQDERDRRVWSASQTQIVTRTYPNISSTQLMVYAEGKLRIRQLNQASAQVKLQDISGKVVWGKEVTSSEFLSLPSFPSGWYLMTLAVDHRLHYQRIWIP